MFFFFQIKRINLISDVKRHLFCNCIKIVRKIRICINIFPYIQIKYLYSHMHKHMLNMIKCFTISCGNWQILKLLTNAAFLNIGSRYPQISRDHLYKQCAEKTFISYHNLYLYYYLLLICTTIIIPTCTFTFDTCQPYHY